MVRRSLRARSWTIRRLKSRSLKSRSLKRSSERRTAANNLMAHGLLYYLMIPLLALAALFQSTAAGRLALRGVKPDLVLLLVLIGVLLYGPRIGLVWAFFGGIFLDVFSGGPMGASSLALMAAVFITGLGYRTVFSLPPAGADWRQRGWHSRLRCDLPGGTHCAGMASPALLAWAFPSASCPFGPQCSS